jgi:hypothetical protein
MAQESPGAASISGGAAVRIGSSSSSSSIVTTEALRLMSAAVGVAWSSVLMRCVSAISGVFSGVEEAPSVASSDGARTPLA